MSLPGKVENEEMPLRHKITKALKVFNFNDLNFVKPLSPGVFVANITFRNGFNYKSRGINGGTFLMYSW